jgi:hypothetical protein
MAMLAFFAASSLARRGTATRLPPSLAVCIYDTFLLYVRKVTATDRQAASSGSAAYRGVTIRLLSTHSVSSVPSHENFPSKFSHRTRTTPIMNLEERIMPSRQGPTLLLFGSLSVSFDAAALTQLHKAITDTDGQRWMLEVIEELPGWWRAVTDVLQIPTSQAEAGQKQLEDLKGAFATGRQLTTSFPLPNKILVPLVVMLQLAQYAAFLARTAAEVDGRVDMFAASAPTTETLGLCTGLLSAFAVSSAGNREQFARYGAVAIRLGMLVGTVADMDGDLASKCLSTEWNSPESHEEMLRILAKFPEVSNCETRSLLRHGRGPPLTRWFRRPTSQSTTTTTGPP